ncbi:MAG TPA: PT domain-containing protein [Anaerolineales bacterium]|nr:PT domain-containing protein [Anaerolineales bacterium]
MAFSHRLAFSAALILLICSCGGANAATPSSAETSEPPTQSAALPTVVPTAPPIIQPTAPPAIPERRMLTLEFPPRIRAGDSDVVRLTLEVDKSGNITPTAVVGGDVVTGEVIEIPNLYETHHVIAEARLDVAGLQISPPDLTSQTLLPGQTIQFFWSIRPDQVGVYRGTAWLFLRFVDKVSGEESRSAVSAQSVEVEAVNLFGLSGKLVRSVGAVGSVVGTVIGFPFFEDIVRYVFKKRKGRAK